MITTIAEPETKTPTTDAKLECIACDCRPLVTFCGAYDDSPLVDDWDESECGLMLLPSPEWNPPHSDTTPGHH